MSFIERARNLTTFDWYFAVDLENGYRHLPVEPSDWHAQVYPLGPEEYYIDIGMPFGKSNSSKYSVWVQNWCKAIRHHFHKNHKLTLESYVDDIYGGASTYDLKLQLKPPPERTNQNAMVLTKI